MLRRLIIPALLLAATTAGAQVDPRQPPPPDPVFDTRVQIQASLGYATTSTTLRLDASDDTPGTELDAEQDLGLDDAELSGRVEVTLRPRPRHRVRLGLNYLPSDRSATVDLERDIVFGDQTYLVDETVDSALRIRTWSMSYSYSFLRFSRAEIAASLGITSIDFDAEAGVRARGVRETEERSAPAPQVGLEAAVRVYGNWYVEGRYQYVKIDADAGNGKFTQLDAALSWQFDPSIAVGLSYSNFDISVESVDPGDSGLIKYQTGGPQLFIRANF